MMSLEYAKAIKQLTALAGLYTISSGGYDLHL
jgi:hypothetical protein